MLHIAKTDLKYDSDHVASFDAKISCFYKDIKEKLNIFYVGDIKKKKKLKYQAIMVGHLGKSQPD